jgi:hypothetical protein
VGVLRDRAARAEGKAAPDAAPYSPEQAHEPLVPLDEGFYAAAREAGPLGYPTLLGGGDIEDQTATLIVYRSNDDPSQEHPVLYCKVLASAEPKLARAKALAEGAPTITVTREVEVQEPAGFDGQLGVLETIVAAAKSINHHHGQTPPEPVPDKHKAALTELRKQLQGILAQLKEPERQVAEGYLGDIDELLAVIDDPQAKTPKHYSQRTVKRAALVEQKIPVAPEPGIPVPKEVLVLPATRPAISLKNGKPFYSGRTKELGEEWRFDLGDGWIAIYHPSKPPVPFSHRGTLELHMPPDPSAVKEIPARLKMLNLSGSPATHAENEVVYLERMAWALGVERGAEVTEARRAARAAATERAAALILSGSAQRPEEAILAAERDTAPVRAQALRSALERSLHLKPGSLANHPNYRIKPEWDQFGPGSGAWRWTRFDADPDEIANLSKRHYIFIAHSVTGDRMEGIQRILSSGVLASQERRLKMGLRGYGLSPIDDQKTGGASYVFAKLVTKLEPYLILWKPETLMVRSDWFLRFGDHFGATNPEDYRYTSMLTNPVQALREFVKRKEKEDKDPTNEICIKDAIGMHGPFAPFKITLPSYKRIELLLWCEKKGITHIGGRLVEDVIEVV